MKKLIMALLMLTSYGALKAQENLNAIKINPLSAFLLTASTFYERKIDENKSLQLGLSYSGMSLDDVGYKGFSITPELRIYANHKALNAFYVAPFLRHQNFKVKDQNGSARVASFGGGILAGRQWVFLEGFTLDIFAGPAYAASEIKIMNGRTPDVTGNLKGLSARFGVAFGFAFN